MSDGTVPSDIASGWRWPSVARVRLMSGLVLFVYVTIHLFNHALGIISLDAQAAGGAVMAQVWGNWPMTILLYGSLAAHVAASLWRVVRRRSLKMRASEWTQLAFGIAIPLLLVTHVMGTRYTSAVYDLRDSYEYVLLSTIVYSPYNAVLNALGLVAAWVHGCIGMHRWLSFTRVYTDRVRFFALIAATLLPVLALAGYLAAGREITPLAADGEWLEAYYERLRFTTSEVWAWIAADTDVARWLILVLFGGAVVVRIVRQTLLSRRAGIRIAYRDGPTISQPPGSTLLEMSDRCGVPHASVCGGKGRCSTCRVQILTAEKPVEDPQEAEQRLLTRVGAPSDVRLACQLKPTGDMTVLRLLPSDATLADASRVKAWATGQERNVTVMFADLRDFTRVAESRLPYDVVYLINQFSRAMGVAVEARDGRIDKFLGDGFMALFGLGTDPKTAARAAIMAAGDMLRALDDINGKLAKDLDEPLRMGIGVHSGPVILGDMGYGEARGLTAIGDAVNTASRLESATKTFGAPLCVSAETVSTAGFTPDRSLLRATPLRGKSAELDVYAVDAADVLAREVEAVSHPS